MTTPKEQDRKAPTFTREQFRRERGGVMKVLEEEGAVTILDEDGKPHLRLSRQREPFDDTEALRAEVEKLKRYAESQTSEIDAQSRMVEKLRAELAEAKEFLANAAPSAEGPTTTEPAPPPKQPR